MRACVLTLACVSACSSPIVERNGVVFGGVCRGFWDCTGAALGASWSSYQKQSQFYPAEWSESCTLDPDYSVRFLSFAWVSRCRLSFPFPLRLRPCLLSLVCFLFLLCYMTS